MTQAQAIAKGYTHFIEVWRAYNDKEGENEYEHEKFNIKNFDKHLLDTKKLQDIYTVCIFLIKPKQ